MSYRRVLLKLSGEVFGGPAGAGFDPDVIHSLATQVRHAANLGIEVCVVIGGGNILRGASFSQGGVNRATADYMGMLATVINGLAFQSALESLGVPTRTLSALDIRSVSEPFIQRRALRHLEKGRVIILAGGTGNPFFTTDTTAALRSMELSVDILLKATKVDGVYTADPEKDKTATRFDTLTYSEVLERGLKVMDAAAIALCQEHKVPILVFNLLEEGNIVRAVQGEQIGTLVQGD